MRGGRRGRRAAAAASSSSSIPCGDIVVQHLLGGSVFPLIGGGDDDTPQDGCVPDGRRLRPACPVSKASIVVASLRSHPGPSRRKSSVANRASRMTSASFEPPVFNQPLLEALPVAACLCDRYGG